MVILLPVYNEYGYEYLYIIYNSYLSYLVVGRYKCSTVTFVLQMRMMEIFNQIVYLETKLLKKTGFKTYHKKNIFLLI